MYVKQPKKLLILNILDILRKYSDEDHRLSQREIGEILKTEYGMTADRKAIRRNLSELLECGYPIEYSETLRSAPVKGPDGRGSWGQTASRCGRKPPSSLTSTWSASSPMGSCGCSSMACCFPGTSPTASAGSWWKSWKDCPTSTSVPGGSHCPAAGGSV